MSIDSVSRPGVVLPVHVDPTGVAGPTPKAVRSKRWRRVGRGWYLPKSVEPGALDQRIVEAMAGMPDDAAVTGWAALAWQGARWFTGLAPDGRTSLPVPIALGDQHQTTTRPGIRLSEDWLFADDVVVVDGLRITVPNRSLTYEVRRAPSLTRALQFTDMAAYDDLVELDDLTAYVHRLVARQGIRLTRKALPFAQENAWSPLEVVMRRNWEVAVDSVFLLCNAPVFDRLGHHLFTPDLLDPGAGIAGEYDGRIHLDDAPRRRDLDREAAYRDHGIELVTMMSGDRADIANFRRRLRSAYDRAQRRTPADTWTLTQPEWWVDTSTVARRRALTPSEREIWLRYRSPQARRT